MYYFYSILEFGTTSSEAATLLNKPLDVEKRKSAIESYVMRYFSKSKNNVEKANQNLESQNVSANDEEKSKKKEETEETDDSIEAAIKFADDLRKKK